MISTLVKCRAYKFSVLLFILSGGKIHSTTIFNVSKVVLMYSLKVTPRTLAFPFRYRLTSVSGILYDFFLYDFLLNEIVETYLQNTIMSVAHWKTSLVSSCSTVSFADDLFSLLLCYHLQMITRGCFYFLHVC